jgi:hypothetical protein
MNAQIEYLEEQFVPLKNVNKFIQTYRVSHNTWDSLYKIRQNKVSVLKNGLEENKSEIQCQKTLI